jgi:uncharacterized protein (UPF0276 family)
MSIRIATPFSSLFRDERSRLSILRLSDAVELRAPGQGDGIGLTKIFHCDLNLVSDWEESQKELLRRTANHDAIEMISVHLASRYEHNLLRNGVFEGTGAPFTAAQMEAHIQSNVAFLRELYGPDFPILVENNNDLRTDAYRVVTDGDFIHRIILDHDLRLLWDIAHSRITAVNRHMEHEVYVSSLPLERCVQIHLSRHGMQDGMACDTHDYLLDEDWQYFQDQISRLPKLNFVTIEYYQDAAVLQEQLRRLRAVLQNF